MYRSRTGMENVEVVKRFFEPIMDGDGYGYGYGSGSGDGDGDGSGYGDGYGLKCYNGAMVVLIDSIPTLIERIKGYGIAKGFIIESDLSLTRTWISRCGNWFAHGRTLREAVEAAEAKHLNNAPIEDRIHKFADAFPSLSSTGTGRQFYEWHHILTGSCTQGRESFCRAHNVQMDAVYTVDYFIKLTSESYGMAIIKKLKEHYDERA